MFAESLQYPELADRDLALRPLSTDAIEWITAACQEPAIPRWTTIPRPYERHHAAEYVAESAAPSLEDRYPAVVAAVAVPALIAEVRKMTADPAVRSASRTLRDPNASPEEAAAAKAVLKNHPSYALLQDDLRTRWSPDEEQSWFITDDAGVQIARVPEDSKRDTIGVYYAWRTYFNGGERDLPPGTAPATPAGPATPAAPGTAASTPQGPPSGLKHGGGGGGGLATLTGAVAMAVAAAPANSSDPRIRGENVLFRM